MTTHNESPGVERITAAPGSKDYERQFQMQSSNAIQRIARMPLVRAVCGLLTMLYIALVLMASFFFVRTQIVEGFNLWEAVLNAACLVPMWWLISMQGRIALYGELSTGQGLFAARQTSPRNS